MFSGSSARSCFGFETRLVSTSQLLSRAFEHDHPAKLLRGESSTADLGRPRRRASSWIGPVTSKSFDLRCFDASLIHIPIRFQAPAPRVAIPSRRYSLKRSELWGSGDDHVISMTS